MFYDHRKSRHFAICESPVDLFIPEISPSVFLSDLGIPVTLMKIGTQYQLILPKIPSESQTEMGFMSWETIKGFLNYQTDSQGSKMYLEI